MEKSVPVLEDLPPVEGRNVLVRTDFNVPMAGGRITDDLRIRLPLETLTWLLDQGAARVTTASHLGRPKGQPDPAFDMEPVRRHLEPAGGRGRRRRPGHGAARTCASTPARRPAISPSPRSWSPGRTCLSTTPSAPPTGPTRRSSARPVSALGRRPGRWPARSRCWRRCSTGAARPFVAVLGGSKVSDKLGVIEALLDRVDALVVGGGMCFTFLAAQGHGIGESLFEPDSRRELRRGCWSRAGSCCPPTSPC